VKFFTKKNGVFLLLILAAIPLFYTLIFRFEQLVIRRKMKEKLESQLLHTITLTKKDVQWIEEGKEILITGEMFDIKSSVLSHGYYSFTGLYDKEETSLINQLENTQKQTSSSNNKFLFKLFQWLQFVYNVSKHNGNFAYNDFNQEYLLITPALSEQFIGVAIPPPKTS
jgi:hypothetical protein